MNWLSHTYPHLIGFAVLSLVVNHVTILFQLKSILFSIYGGLCIALILSSNALIFVLLLNGVFYMTCHYVIKHKIFYYVAFFVLLLTITSSKLFIYKNLRLSSPSSGNIFIYTMCLQIQRILAFVMEKLDDERTSAMTVPNRQLPSQLTMQIIERHTWKNLLFYNLYPPHLFLAPYIPFKTILVSIDKPIISPIIIVQHTFHVLLCYCIFECVIRFYSLYFLQQPHYSFYLSSFSLLSIYTYKSLLDLMFSTKYKVLFGIYGLFMLIDGTKPQPIPICFYAVRSLGELWRKFDVGLYVFIRDLFYIPMGGNRMGSMRRMLAVLSAFVVITCWHGGTRNVALWTLFNFGNLVLEIVLLDLIEAKKDQLTNNRILTYTFLRSIIVTTTLFLASFANTIHLMRPKLAQIFFSNIFARRNLWILPVLYIGIYLPVLARR